VHVIGPAEFISAITPKFYRVEEVDGGLHVVNGSRDLGVKSLTRQPDESSFLLSLGDGTVWSCNSHPDEAEIAMHTYKAPGTYRVGAELLGIDQRDRQTVLWSSQATITVVAGTTRQIRPAK